MPAKIVRSYPLRSTPSRLGHLPCAHKSRFYSVVVNPDTQASATVQPTTELHNDFTSFISRFRTALPARPQPNTTQYRIKDLKFVSRNLSSETLPGNRLPKHYTALAPLLEIPEPPPRPGYPAPWLHGPDAEALPPLYARLWRVYASPMRRSPKHLYLGKHMFFTNSQWAEEFQKHIELLMEKTQHHGHIDRRGYQLFYATNTHSAISHDLDSSKGGGKIEAPGITALDVRIAIRVEELWDKWLREGKAMLPPPGTTDSGVEVMNITGFAVRSITRPNAKPSKSS